MNCLSHLLFLLFADMVGSGRFTEAVRAAHKGKAIAIGVANRPTKQASPPEAVIVLPPPPPQPMTPFLPESSALGASASSPTPADVPSPSVPIPSSVVVESSSMQEFSA